MTQTINPALRTRQTTATERRDTNFRRLIAELSLREMTSAEVEKLFGYSPSGARKYLRNLCEAGVAVIGRTEIDGKKTWPIFKAATDQVALAAFLTTLGKPQQPKQKAQPTREVAPGCHVHVMGGDEPYRIRARFAAPARDPMVSALFGDGPARGVA